MRDHHIKHMKKIITLFVTGLSEKPSYFEKKHYAKYGSKINYVIGEINYDIKHGVRASEVLDFLDSINLSGMETKSENEESLKRVDEIRKFFVSNLIEQK